MTPLHRTLSSRLPSKLPPFRPWACITRFSTLTDDGASALTVSAIPVASTAAPPYESSPPIDTGSSIRNPISLWPGMYFSPVTNALWEARSKILEEFGNVGVSDIFASPESVLDPRSPSRSRTSIFYKFSSDYVLREQCRNPWNEIRMGKLVDYML